MWMVAVEDYSYTGLQRESPQKKGLLGLPLRAMLMYAIMLLTWKCPCNLFSVQSSRTRNMEVGDDVGVRKVFRPRS